MFDIGAGELLLIMIVVLIAFGPRKLPELAQSLGRGIREFKRAQREFTDQINSAFEQEQRRQTRTVNRPDHPAAPTPEQPMFPAHEASRAEQSILPPGLAAAPIPGAESEALSAPAASNSIPADTLPDEATIAEVPPNTVQRGASSQLGIFGAEGGAKESA